MGLVIFDYIGYQREYFNWLEDRFYGEVKLGPLNNKEMKGQEN